MTNLAFEIMIFDPVSGEVHEMYETHDSNRMYVQRNQHDWHCMAYAIYLLQQYHNGAYDA